VNIATGSLASDSEPLLYREGLLFVCSKKGDQSLLSKYRGFGVFSMNKTGIQPKLTEEKCGKLSFQLLIPSEVPVFM
jgi:hypothetical protein